MTIPALFKEYIWLVNTIREANGITFAEINDKWLDTEMSDGVELARSTFARHKDAIEDIFGIYIDCDRQNGYKYYVGNEEVLSEELVECVVDFFFARDFETRGAICFEFFYCCHFSSFIFFLLKYTQKWGRGYKEL